MSAPREVLLLPAAAAPEGGGPVATARLGDLARRVLGGRGAEAGRWAVKLQLGRPGRAAAVAPDWAGAVAAALGGDGAFACDTLSITTAGLDTAPAQRDLARIKGYGAGGALPYVVADDPAAGPSLRADLPPGSDPEHVDLARAGAEAAGLAVLTAVRPHPHLGFAGALASLGLGLVDRGTKLLLHSDVRPQVDTPLCAGCGACLAVCLFDAIVLRGGRATIDHTRCTGCGECMNVCFMAGIGPEEAAGIPRFQERVAAAAQAARDGARPGRPAVYLNVLVRPDRAARGPRGPRDPVGDVGVLAAADPVALDRATWDLVAGRAGGSLQGWSGFLQEPGPLLERAAALGLGRPDYRLREL